MAYGGSSGGRARLGLVPALAWVLAGALGVACSGSSADPMNSTSGDPIEVPPWACVPGETQPCDCADALTGLRTCDSQGAGFGECDCSPGAVSQGPPPTSTGTDAGTASDTASTGATASGDASTSGDPTTSDPTTAGSSGGGPDPSTSGGSTGPGGSTGGTSSSG